MWLKQRSALELIGVVAGAVAGVAGAIGGVLALTGGGTPPPDPQAELRVTSFEKNVTRGDFARRYPTAALPGSSDATVGGVFSLDLRFHDYDGRRCELTWTMYDDAIDAPVPGLADRPGGTFELTRPFVHVTPVAWVPAPRNVVDMYVIFRLRDGDEPCGSPFQSNTYALE
jgi:hypothetical protein